MMSGTCGTCDDIWDIDDACDNNIWDDNIYRTTSSWKIERQNSRTFWDSVRYKNKDIKLMYMSLYSTSVQTQL